GPDLLGLAEIENQYVLELLVAALAPLNRNYGIAHSDSPDSRGIDVAFLYDQDQLTAEEKFFHFVMRRTATRDLVQVNFRTSAGKLFVVIGNHWPSRSGGELESEPYRMMAGETLAYFHDRIRQVQNTDDVAVLAMGDFNDEPFSPSLVEYALSERSRAKVTNARTARFLNLMWPLMGQNSGTHYFDNYANMLDQFLVAKGLLTGNSGLEAVMDSLRIFRVPEMVKPGEYPGPIKFGRPSSKDLNENGFSDHFPILIQVRES
ncbi:MAG TPA: endonuclease/exonuclease/phosphatase, partial [Nitrospirota bacterium]